METNSENPLTSKDLILVMEAYKNNIELTSALTEHMKQVLIQTDDVLETQKSLLLEIAGVAKIFRDLSSKMLEKQSEMQSDVLEKFNEVQIESVRETSSIRNVLYLTLIGGSGIIASLITLALKVTEKLDIIDKIATAVGVK